MPFHSELKPAKLIKRYKRFLADVELPDGSVTTLHVANTGAMTGCGSPGDTVWYSTSDNPKRKLPLSWELTQTNQDHLICVNTIRANQVVEKAILNGRIPALTGYANLRREVKYGEEKSKIDFLLTDGNKPDTYVEVKSVTLLHDNQGYFPDAKTERGQKHLRELMHIANSGHRAVLLFCVLHSGIESVEPAAHIDPKYAELFQQASDSGVEILTYRPEISTQKIC